MSKNFKMIAKTFYGFEDVLARELLKLGAQKIEKGLRNVSFYGDKGFLYKSNLCLRTALRILKPIFQFKFKDIEDYYKNINNYKWEELIDVDSSFVINSVPGEIAFVFQLIVVSIFSSSLILSILFLSRIVLYLLSLCWFILANGATPSIATYRSLGLTLVKINSI